MGLGGEELRAIRLDTERHLRNGSGCSSCAKNVLALLDRLAAAEAVVAEVEALTQRWERDQGRIVPACAAKLRAALAKDAR